MIEVTLAFPTILMMTNALEVDNGKKERHPSWDGLRRTIYPFQAVISEAIRGTGQEGCWTARRAVCRLFMEVLSRIRFSCGMR